VENVVLILTSLHIHSYEAVKKMWAATRVLLRIVGRTAYGQKCLVSRLSLTATALDQVRTLCTAFRAVKQHRARNFDEILRVHDFEALE
jgi:hypothetical protein